MYDIRRKEWFKSKCIEHASKACNGEPRIKYSVENVGENKLWGEFDFEANRRSDISKYFSLCQLVQYWRFGTGNVGESG